MCVVAMKLMFLVNTLKVGSMQKMLNYFDLVQGMSILLPAVFQELL